MSLEDVTPADGIVRGDELPEYTNVWRVTDGTGQPIGQWHDRLERRAVDADGRSLPRPLIVRTQRSLRLDGTHHDHLDEVDAHTLAPLRAHWREGESTRVDIRWQGRRFTGRHWLVVPGSGGQLGLPLEVSVELPAPAFDWHLWGVLVAGFPLADGYRASFLARSGGSSGAMEELLRRFSLQVIGRERAAGIDCWVVLVDAGVPWTFWIATTRQPRPVVQLRIDRAAGPGTPDEPANVRWYIP
jgi:hypothetical protein